MSVWNRKIWGVEFSSPGQKPILIGTAWMTPRPQSQYDGEPTRAILFMTREQAREWCKAKKAQYSKRPDDCCSRWRFKPVRVVESVKRA